MKTTNPFEIDELRMYFGDDYTINDFVTVHQPTVGEIVEYGEEKYYSGIAKITAIPSDMKSKLWDAGIDYSKMTDYELFLTLTRSTCQEDTALILGDIDLSELKIDKNPENEKLVLTKNGEIIIDELIYLKMVNYIRKFNCIVPKIEKPATETVKKILIQLDRERIQKEQSKPYTSQLKIMISAMMRYPGFKYKTSELRECGIYEFMDTFKGAQIYVASTALLQGSYSGMVDTSKIDSKQFNWLRDTTDQDRQGLFNVNAEEGATK